MRTFPFLTNFSKKGILSKALFLLLVAASFSACKEPKNPYVFDTEGQKLKDELVIRQYFRANNVDTTKVVRTESGLYYLNVTPGTGDLIKAGEIADVHYIGTNIWGNEFDNSYNRGSSFSVTVGAGRVIKGWDEGLQLMKVGEEARLFVPSHLGYGPRGSGSIPGNSILIFDMKVLRKR
ncbi:FKBP-type peptidyl-prolyl cis-trans isomerase [Pontibacter beigongshangensis]|uniref:FKBP-type peptidyl-prolyl cis-trans isomerase n=1 Tax=Pontibacter beigongshangensis TaxID=2574733 RepID=UPI001650CA23|nr:FKBP-type peptidyl-prolyl cis-trans isomerase [Pontibacter beigongshangensis]